MSPFKNHYFVWLILPIFFFFKQNSLIKRRTPTMLEVRILSSTSQIFFERSSISNSNLHSGKWNPALNSVAITYKHMRGSSSDQCPRSTISRDFFRETFLPANQISRETKSRFYLNSDIIIYFYVFIKSHFCSNAGWYQYVPSSEYEEKYTY